VEGKIQVAKNAPIVISETLRDMPCDRCKKVGRLCLPQTKGGQVLTACARCYGLKMSCKTHAGPAARDKDAEQPVNMVMVKEEGEAVEQAPMPVTTEAIPGRAHRPQRMAAVWAKACLNKYHKLPFLVRDPTDSQVQSQHQCCLGGSVLQPTHHFQLEVALTSCT